MLYRQPQRHCKNSVIKQVLVTPFGFTKTCFVLVLQGSSQNLSTKTFCFGFFLSREPKLLPKLASLIRDENSQNIAYRYKTYIRRNQKKRKKVSVGCKDRHKRVRPGGSIDPTPNEGQTAPQWWYSGVHEKKRISYKFEFLRR